MQATLTMSDLERVSALINKDVKASLQACAERQGRSTTAQLEQILAAYLVGAGFLAEMPARKENRGGDRRSDKKTSKSD